jgi:hypothetical protein
MMKKTAIIRLRGGFGNQLFQYLNALNLEKVENVRILLDFKQVNRFHDKIGISALELKYTRTKILTDLNYYFLKSKIFKKIRFMIPIHVMEDIDISKASIEKIAQMTKQKISVRKKYKIDSDKEFEISKLNDVIVHMRLGDMFRLGLASDEKYFQKAISIFADDKKRKYIIFTDDETNFSVYYEKYLISMNLNYSVVSDKFLGSQLFNIFSESKNFIGSNSSLSLVSALMNEIEDAKILLPSSLNGLDLNSIKLIPDKWIVI